MALPEVIEITGRSRSTIYRDIAAGTFPESVKIGNCSKWTESVIGVWMADAIARAKAEAVAKAKAKAESEAEQAE